MNMPRPLFGKSEVWWALSYFGVYLVYHSAIGGESDAMHWLGLVILPMGMLAAVQWVAAGKFSFWKTLRSVGSHLDVNTANREDGVGPVSWLGFRGVKRRIELCNQFLNYLRFKDALGQSVRSEHLACIRTRQGLRLPLRAQESLGEIESLMQFAMVSSETIYLAS